MKDDNIKMLESTLKILENGCYCKDGRNVNLFLSRREMEHVQVLLPEEVNHICGQIDSDKTLSDRKCRYNCENIDSFALAKKRCKDMAMGAGRGDAKGILVLNLANPVNPGGGVRRGARAQEEDLCRKSSLLLSLESKEAEKYYEYNKRLGTYMGSDAVLFTPKVEIIRDENGELLDDTIIVAVLTCAAPMVRRGKEGMSEGEYQDMVRHRIEGMLKCAAHFRYRNLILGAWGCGAFGNDARVISDLFYDVLKEMEKSKKMLFDRVDFAVLDRVQQQVREMPKSAGDGGYNFKEFYRNFAPGGGTETKLTAVKGDITEDHGVQAIVNAANTSLLGGGGVDGAIHRAAGPGLLSECRTLNGCKTGKAKITKGYRLPCEYVIHTPGPCWSGGSSGEEDLLASCYQSCLELAAGKGIRSVAFPSISTGIYRFPLDRAAKIAVRTVKRFVQEHPGKLDVVKWVLFDERTLKSYARELEGQDI